MAFKRVKGSDRGLVRRKISSLACAVGDLMTYSRSAGTVVKATSALHREDVAGVVVETTTTADTSVLLQRIVPQDEYIVDVTNASDAAHNYQRMALTDEKVVNNTGTDSAASTAFVMQTGVVGVSGDKKILVEFIEELDEA
jgi:hypothetical protein